MQESQGTFDLPPRAKYVSVAKGVAKGYRTSQRGDCLVVSSVAKNRLGSDSRVRAGIYTTCEMSRHPPQTSSAASSQSTQEHR